MNYCRFNCGMWDSASGCGSCWVTRAEWPASPGTNISSPVVQGTVKQGGQPRLELVHIQWCKVQQHRGASLAWYILRLSRKEKNRSVKSFPVIFCSFPYFEIAILQLSFYISMTDNLPSLHQSLPPSHLGPSQHGPHVCHCHCLYQERNDSALGRQGCRARRFTIASSHSGIQQSFFPNTFFFTLLIIVIRNQIDAPYTKGTKFCVSLDTVRSPIFPHELFLSRARFFSPLFS